MWGLAGNYWDLVSINLGGVAELTMVSIFGDEV
jgi:hypothetical protein